MKTLLRFVLTAAFFIFPLGIQAAMWSSVISSEKMRAEIDVASMFRQGNIVTAWDREVYSSLVQARPGDFYFKSAKTLVRYNCSGRTADLLMKVFYAEDGSEITTITASYYGKPNYVIPDTEGEQKFEHVCQYKSPEEKKLAAAAASEAKKKSEKPEESDELIAVTVKKNDKGAKDKASVTKSPRTPPQRSAPIIKPSDTLPKAAENAKGER